MEIRNRIPKQDDAELITLARETFHIESDLVRKVLDHAETIILCDEDNNMMGFLSYRFLLPGVMNVEYAVLDKKYRGRGIAKVILPHLINHARQEGIRAVTGFVKHSNDISLHIFKKWGFVPLYNYQNGAIIGTLL